MCVKNSICKYVHNVETFVDQVWIKISLLSDFTLGACYIPPTDSPFFTQDAYAHIQENCIAGNCLLVGDLNSRMPNLNRFGDSAISYTENPDTGKNMNGTNVSSVCEQCDMTPVNHAVMGNRSFRGNLSFRKKRCLDISVRLGDMLTQHTQVS